MSRLVRAFAAGAAALALLAACASPAPVEPPAADPAESSIAPFAIDQDFPDPDLLSTGGEYYAYATNAPGINVQLARSSDLQAWEVLSTDALPELPEWSLPGKTWAPDVSEFSPGHFVMYFTVANAEPEVQCIGVATSSSAEGPFQAQGDGPIVCPDEDGGAIDPSTFVAKDGKRYLLFKNDGNCCAKDTWLQIVELSADGLSLEGDATRLLKQDQPWEGNLIEAPTLVERDGRYVLFYSANDYGSDQYAIGYATADAATGPYAKADGPLLTTELADDRYLGPGGQDVIATPEGDSFAFHSWDEVYIYRGIHLVPLSWEGGLPVLALP